MKQPQGPGKLASPRLNDTSMGPVTGKTGRDVGSESFYGAQKNIIDRLRVK
jgi:hypothetical protein